LVLLILIGDLAAGNFLVTFAIARKQGVNMEVVPEPVTKTDAELLIEENTKFITDKIEAWLADAKTVGEEVGITSHDGLSLKGIFYPANADDHRYALIIHGYTSQKEHMLGYAAYYAEAGYHILMPDLRGHGESEGNYIGMGWLDKDDIISWIRYLVEKDPEARIILHGVSMGGATVMMTSGEELPSNVKAIVEDCGYTSVWDIFSDEVAYLFHIPTFPVLDTASVLAGFRAGYNFHEASSLDQVKKATVPMFFAHGSEDNFVHADMVYPLYEACPTEKEIYVVQGAGHGQAMYLDPDTYFSKVFTFLNRYI
jgi:fermentation-respiration switch protein FrsA (DUF1100 family)